MNLQRVAVAVSFACLPLVAGAQGAKVDPALAKVSKDFSAAFGTKDAAKVASFYTDDAVVLPPNEPAVKGRNAIQAWMQKQFDMGATSLTLTPSESAVSGNIGYQAEAYTFTLKLKDGTSLTDKGKSLVVYKQVGGKWLMAHDIFNSDMPATPTPATAKPVPPAAPAKK